MSQGRWVQACVEFRKGIEVGEYPFESYLLMKLWELKGRSELRQANYDECLNSYQNSLDIAQDIGNEDGETLIKVAIDVALSMSGSAGYGAKLIN